MYDLLPNCGSVTSSRANRGSLFLRQTHDHCLDLREPVRAAYFCPLVMRFLGGQKGQPSRSASRQIAGVSPEVRNLGSTNIVRCVLCLRNKTAVPAFKAAVTHPCNPSFFRLVRYYSGAFDDVAQNKQRAFLCPFGWSSSFVTASTICSCTIYRLDHSQWNAGRGNEPARRCLLSDRYVVRKPPTSD